ncbi:MAG: S-methyl-5-thioribose-1-phosphate isomerase [Candidatus Omnitrophica bacterium]|nr:S-methyl-5-thioribose-1-phosphate isomerase [Candidatus Omnitrophota bacterium]
MKKMIKTIEWKHSAIKIIDQTKLPPKLKYLYIKDLRTLWHAIRRMQIRGAPALGVAAALGVYLGIRDLRTKNFSDFCKELDSVTRYISTARPTARNLFWALERICSIAVTNRYKPIKTIKKLIFREAQKIIDEDKIVCRKIGVFGEKLIKNGSSILTICNTGALATVDYGTALGAIYRAKERGKKIKIYVCETRPLLQGSRLTAWELKKNGIDTILITDNMAATLMQEGKIDLVIAGADRIAANGDSANKIGTYNLAVLATYHKIPFYIAAPTSTFDFNLRSGRDIPIEQRNPKEVTHLFFKQSIAPAGTKVYNPAFDVTPHKLITAIITEKGIITPPYERNIMFRLRGKGL